jgi:hypothetical protein
LAPRISKKIILAVGYMPQSLGMALDESALTLGDNMSLVLNTTATSSIFEKEK